MSLEKKLNFKYYNYNQNLFKEIINSKAEIYIFENYYDLKEALKNYNPLPLSQQSLFLTIKEFEERLFSSQKIVLKEEKLPLILYSVLTAEEKKELRIFNYQDIYQFSARFFSYFNLLLDYQLNKISGLTAWQQQRSSRLKNIKERYQKKLKRLGYTDYITLKEKKNFNLTFLKNYGKINFFNIVDFNPYYKSLLKYLNQEIEVTVHLQLLKNDFDEKTLQLKKISFPEIKKDLEIRKSSSKLKSLAAFLNEKENSATETSLLAAGDEIEEAAVLADSFDLNSQKKYQEHKIYKFLEAFYQLYQQGKAGSEILIELKELSDLLTQKLFKKYLNLTPAELEKIKELIRKDYYYLDLKTIEKEIPVLKKLYQTLVKIRDIDNLTELIELLTSLTKTVLAEEKKESIEKLSDSMFELKSVEELAVVIDWNDYYSDKGKGLFSLFLNHLAYKKISLNKSENSLSYYSSLSAPQLKRKKVLINNCTQDKFAHSKAGLYFLSEKQLQDNGINFKDKKQFWQKYKFLRHIFNADQAVIFTVENEAENIIPAVILEELALDFNLDYQDSKLNKLSEKQILNNLFAYNEKQILKRNSLKNFNQNIKLEKNDFGDYFNFTYYKYKSLKDCYHRFYLEQLVKLETELEIKPSLSLMTVGILTHQIFADLILYAREKKIKVKNITAEFRKKTIKKAINDCKLKIDKEYFNFYNQIIYKSIDNSFKYFTELVDKDLPKDHNNILVEWPEWSYQRQKYFTAAEIDFYLSGRIDLLLLNQLRYFIIDFKTGAGDKKQLDFYSLMLRQNYSQKLPAESKKAIYNIFAEKLEYSYNNFEKEEKLGAELEELSYLLFENKEYQRIYKSRCQRCPYRKICRVEVENNEQSY